MLDAGKVKKGANSGDHPDGAFSPHTGNIHFDAPYLPDAVSGNVALSDVANAALHEAMHALSLSNTHPGGPMGKVSGVLIYAERPFSYLNPGVDSCVLY
jgi:hypothetical protein